MALSVKLYRVVGKRKDRRYVPIDLGRRGRRSKEDVTGPFYLRYGVKYESVGMDFKAAVEAMQRRQATLDGVCSGVTAKQDGDPNRKRVKDEIKKFLAKKSLLKDSKTVKAYIERLGYFLDWCERTGIKHLDQLTHGDELLPYVAFLRQRKTAKDTLFEPRYVYNIFQTCNTFLRANAILFAGEILGYGKERYTKAYGAAGTPDRVFIIASISKVIVATGAMVLKDRGRLALQDRVARFVPEFRCWLMVLAARPRDSRRMR
jgi:Beta-lactamase